MASFNPVRDDLLKHYSMVTRLIHYSSKFTLADDPRSSKPYPTTRNRLPSNLDSIDKSAENRRFRLAPIWPEWNEAEINNELWDMGSTKKKDTTTGRSRSDAKANISVVIHTFEDPEGKIELPPSMKVEQWKRPIDFVPSDRSPAIVDPNLGIHNFDLISSNEHLHRSEIMRNIISEMITLWNICRTTERVWRPWEHIYALTKVSKPPFITPYNPAGKYIVRLFFLGTWRKIIIDDSIPLDSHNRCLLPQTTLSHELWPMLLTKALLKVISLDFNASSDSSEYSGASVIHLLTGWIPEPIPLKYAYAEKIWNFLRYGQSDKHAVENELQPPSSSGLVPVYKWPNPPIRKAAIVKGNLSPAKEVKKPGGNSRRSTAEVIATIADDKKSSQEPKMIVVATMSHSPSARLSSYTETANRSERLRRYNLNETFSTSVLITSIRDIPLIPPPLIQPSESIPAWKLIRPRKAKVLPQAEPIVLQEPKRERWIEIASPYINYPTSSVLNMMIATPTARAQRSTKRLPTPNPLNIIEVDEDEDSEQEKLASQLDSELVRSTTSISLPTTKKELNGIEPQEKFDESTRKAKLQPSRKSAGVAVKLSSEVLSTKSKSTDNEQTVAPIDVPTIVNHTEQTISSRKSNPLPKIWMNFDDFCACFTSVIVFHNPRGYQFNHQQTEIKFTPYQPIVSPTIKEKKKESNQPVIQTIPNLQEDRSSSYLFVDSTRETLGNNIELIISLTSLPRWYDSTINETIVSTRGTAEKTLVSQKEIIPQMGSLIAEVYSWKSLSIGQPILRLHTTATKAALLTLPPGRHVLKLTNACPFAFNLNILSDTNDFLLVDEDQLLNKITSVPENAEFHIRSEELFFALEDSIENFHLINQQENQLFALFRSFCQQTPKSIHLTIHMCLHAFHQALYSTLRTVIGTSGSTINAETQFAWRCFTNDLLTPDILGAYEIKRPSATSANRHSTRTDGRSSAGTSKRTGGNNDKMKHSSSISDVQEDFLSDWLSREMTIDEIDAIASIQKAARGFLQRRIDLGRRSGTEKNLFIQRALRSTLSLLKADANKSALLLFKNFISAKPQLIQCFPFRNDDWNMVTYRDHTGLYQEQPANTWFILFREIFYVTEESFIAAKFLSHLPNSLLRVINNDTYEEMPLVFNRLAPGIFTKNKNGYTFFAEGMSLDQPISTGRFRLRLITSYAHLPEPRVEPITSAFVTNETIDYYLPNKEEMICRYRVIFADDINQTGRNSHLASIHFSTSKSDVYMRLTIFDHDQEIVSVEGKGFVVLPAMLFMRPVSNVSQTSSRPSSKTGGSNKKGVGGTRRASVVDLTVVNKESSRSSSRTEISSADGDEKSHKYLIQVKVLRKSWPLTSTQWQFVEQEKNELRTLNRQSSQTKSEGQSSNSTTGKRTGQTNTNPSTTTGKGRSSSVKGRSNTGRATIDVTRPHWILRIISDADKADELTINKDNERNDELLNMKKAWETFQTGRAEKALRTRQKFLDSFQPKSTEEISPDINEMLVNLSDTEISFASIPSISEPVVKQTISSKTSPAKKGSAQTELIPPQLQIEEPLLDEPPTSLKPKISLPPLDLQPFIKYLHSMELISTYSSTEQEQFEYRRNTFHEYLKSRNLIDQYREDDQHHRSNEKLRQLDEYVDLQSRIDQMRRCINEPREAFRGRLLELEHQRLQLLAAEQQRLLDEEKAKAAAMIKPIETKISGRRKKKKK